MTQFRNHHTFDHTLPLANYLSWLTLSLLPFQGCQSKTYMCLGAGHLPWAKLSHCNAPLAHNINSPAPPPLQEIGDPTLNLTKYTLYKAARQNILNHKMLCFFSFMQTPIFSNVLLEKAFATTTIMQLPTTPLNQYQHPHPFAPHNIFSSSSSQQPMATT